MKFHVVLTRRAKYDLDDILTWIERRSQQGAQTWARRWKKIVDQLSTGADACVLAPESAHHDTEIRQIIFKTRRGLPYRALFHIGGDLVSVITIRGPGQDFFEYDEDLGPQN